MCVRVWCVYACTLLTVLLLAWRRRDLGTMWAGDKVRICACVVHVCVHAADGAVVGVVPPKTCEPCGRETRCVCVRVWCVYACTLLTVLLLACRRGDLQAVWEGDKVRACVNVCQAQCVCA